MDPSQHNGTSDNNVIATLMKDVTLMHNKGEWMMVKFNDKG